MGGLWSGLALLLAYALAPLPEMGALLRKTQLALPILTGFGIVLYLAALGLHYLVLAQQRAQEAEAKQLELRLLTQDAELKALRAQINPHFLFNSLNSISALTTLNPQGAREMCIQLSDFLRKSLGLGEKQSVSLREELDLIRTYLSIEKTRFAERLSLAWEVDPAALDVPIPPLLLQPLVENAIKHGISALPEGGVLAIHVLLEGREVRIEVENPRDPDADVPKGLGLGLRQVRERLKGRFGTAGGFDARSDDRTHRVTLRIPMEPM
jgi:LytS/YehU family sensor histidine kinase